MGHELGKAFEVWITTKGRRGFPTDRPWTTVNYSAMAQGIVKRLRDVDGVEAKVKEIPDYLSLSQIRSLGYDFWKKQPTIESGQFDNLVYDDGKHRVWVSRQSLADYDGDRRAFMADRLTVEKRTKAGWVKA